MCQLNILVSLNRECQLKVGPPTLILTGVLSFLYLYVAFVFVCFVFILYFVFVFVCQLKVSHTDTDGDWHVVLTAPPFKEVKFPKTHCEHLWAFDSKGCPRKNVGLSDK